MRTMIAIPCMDLLHTAFFQSCVSLDMTGEVQWTTCQCSLPYDARNKLCELAIDGEFDRVLWLDSDTAFDRHLFRRLSEHLDQGREMVTGLYISRKRPLQPVIYKALRREELPTGGQAARADSYTDFEHDSLFPVAACGFGAVMMTTQLLQDVRDAYGPPFFPALGFGEDLSFCLRVGWLGREIWCDSSIKVGHVGLAVYDEELWRAEAGLQDD